MKYRTKTTLAQAAAASMLALLAVACGSPNVAGPKSARDPYAPMRDGLRALAGVRGLYDGMAIYSVSPPRGPLTGMNPAVLNGSFWDPAGPAELAAAQAAYSVYFGANFAPYDPNVAVPITSSQIFVTVPPGAALGFVDVVLRDNLTTIDAAGLYDGYEYIDFDLIDVDPDLGWIFGFEQTRIIGDFPVSQAFIDTIYAVDAANYYYVQFGNRIAQFDPFFPGPVITTTEMRVLSPPAENVGFVDVSVGAFDASGSVTTFDTLSQAYRYYGMYLFRCIPDQGPLAGGNLVKLEGVFPGLTAISDIYAAEAIYSIYFGANQAPFADLSPNPCFFPSQIDTIRQTYTIGYMYCLAPAGAAPGFVDVRVEDDLDIDLPTTLPDGYEYLGASGVQRWDNATIQPNPIGKLLARELLVTIEGLGTIENAGSAGPGPAFLVPQGGDPSNTSHRILLEEVSYQENGNSFVWQGTNSEPIPRFMPDGTTTGQLVDGHAAVYLFADADGIEIIGDSTDPSDGGIIQADAQTGRHAIIDTIPPRLVQIAGGIIGDDMVQIDLASGDYLTNATNIPPSTDHPYPLPTTHPSNLDDAPSDDRVLTRPFDSENAAQVFFNVASDSNAFPIESLRFVIDGVQFEDVNVYAMTGLAVDPARDTDFFTGDTNRQQAGFEVDPVQPPAGLNRDEAFATHPLLLVSGAFQPSPFNLPNITDIDVAFTTSGATTGSGASLSSNLDITPDRLTAAYTIGDPGDPVSGVQFDQNELYSLIPIVWRAVDRAGNYFPQGDPDRGRRKLWTANDTSPEGYLPNQQPDMGPLNLWWLRSTGTRIVSTVPPSGDARDPSFTWTPTAGPNPPGLFDLASGERLRWYSYALYRSVPLGPSATDLARTREDQRDGPYYNVVPWSTWSEQSALTSAEVRSLLLTIPDGVTENVWFLLVVMSVDEAGNVELWPTGQLDNLAATVGGLDSPDTIDSVTESGEEERNWERWWATPLAETVETIVEPFYWHDQFPFSAAPDPGESTFGDAEVIPYPPTTTFMPPNVFSEIVVAQFRITLITTDPDATVDWILLRNGRPYDSFDADQVPAGGFLVTLTLPRTVPIATDPFSYLGDLTREPTYYTFEAVTVNSDGTQDSSPAHVNFVIVDNVADFIKNRDEAQPIRESDVN